ncbi:MAG: cyanophycinase [Chitinophagales bacterium]|nr:cyanophycinase [Chitinophagales bacterium]
MAKGILVSIGGAEDKGTDLEAGVIDRNRLNFFELGILSSFIKLIQKESPRIEVITTASTIPDEVGENYLDAFSKLDCNNIGHLRIRNREDASNEEYIERLKSADAIMFSGGNQLKLTSIFGGTEFLQILNHRYHNEESFVIAGTSAGAMAMSNTMIYEGNASRSHLKGEVKITTGLAFVKDVIIDSHFDKRGRFSRLAQAVASNPQALGIGLGEDTGVIIRNDDTLEIIGSGAVILVDGQNIRHSNIAEIADGSPISVENIKVHILERGNQYNLQTKKFEAKVNEMI